ncbi:hypothetical protein HDU76_009755, partial [Blyttiomyces sp. JEL0837]
FNDYAEKNLRGKVSIGISTGEILFASLGTDSRREASLLGDVVNIAARLMGINDSTEKVVIDEATHLRSRHLFVHTDIGNHYLKGKENPLHLWTVTSAGPGTDLPAAQTMCGYDDEKKIILDCYSKWKENHKDSVILIEAASGLGKSTLGTFASSLALLDSVGVCLIQGTEIEQRTERNTKVVNDVEVPAYEFMQYHGENPNMAPLLGMVIPFVRIPETEQTEKLDSQAKNNLLKTLILRIFNSFVSKHKCLFIFDDSQWLDDMSLDMIMSFVKFSSKAFILILSRPIADNGPDILDRIAVHSRVKHIKLQGLSRSAVEEIIIKQCSTRSLPIVTVDDILLDGEIGFIIKEKGFKPPTLILNCYV